MGDAAVRGVKGEHKLLGFAPLEPITEVLRIGSGEARFLTWMDILKELELRRIRF